MQACKLSFSYWNNICSKNISVRIHIKGGNEKEIVKQLSNDLFVDFTDWQTNKHLIVNIVFFLRIIKILTLIYISCHAQSVIYPLSCHRAPQEQQVSDNEKNYWKIIFMIVLLKCRRTHHEQRGEVSSCLILI